MRDDLPSKKSTIAGFSVVVSTAAAEKSCHFDICLGGSVQRLEEDR
jgi:hypothetical protein